MNESDLKRFANQLSLWAELVIEHGRTPFRRVDLFPRLHTRMGSFQPPLVFWINRQSLMAGGVILLPDNDLPQQLELGCATAEALGLKHFVTWEKDRVRFWETGEIPREEKQLAVAGGGDPEMFRALLLEVMEQLKLLSVLGMVSPAELTSSYLHNLFQETLNSALGPLITAFRETRAAGGLLETTRADRQADQLNRMTLLRLLALLWHNRLPESILPEKLERAMELALPELPTELARPLAFTREQGTPTLPVDSTVCYHHLLLRLRQIRWETPPQRALEAINQLLNPPRSDSESVFTDPNRDREVLQINPKTPTLGHPRLHELSDSPPDLAAAALLRFINNAPPAEQYSGNMFFFAAPPLPAPQVQGTLINRRRVPRHERQRYDALLRSSWPTRRFKFSPETPCWVLETVHLLGLCRRSAQLQLEIPAAWLSEAFGQPLWELIMENFQLQSVALGNGTTFLEMTKEKPASVITAIRGVAGEQQIDWSEEQRYKRSLLLFNLLFTPEQCRLLNSDHFQPCAETSAQDAIETGLLAYSRTAFAGCLWTVLGGGKLPPTARELRERGTELDWPIPDEGILYQLGLSNPPESASDRSAEDLDQLLSELLDSQVPLDLHCPQLPQLPGPTGNRNKASGLLRAEILQHLDACGLPDFPEQYLYRLERPQLSTYHFQPPLQVVSELLGRYEIIDADRKSLTVHGEALVEALNLCAEQGRNEVELPDDQEQLAAMLASYREDLRQLRQELTRQTHTRLESPQAAERLAKKIWQELNLPAWSWLDH